ncbi:MAG: tetratricopeptide repeat protein [Candidatus Firestonebacteria bacterium]|nr:tetratricopeptide repeat protein [Candidatus Firestonebacteria bacterium]
MKLFKSEFEKYYEQGLAYHNIDKFDEAIAQFKKASEIKPDDARIYFSLGNVYNVKGMHKEAVDAYKQCLKLNPQFSKARYMLKLLSDEQVEKSDQIKDNIVEEIASTYKLGLECAKKNMFEDAIMAWEKTIKLFPNFDKAYLNIGIAYYRLNKIDEAIREWTRAKMINPDNDEVYFCLGIAYYEQNRIPEAVKEWEKGKEINPKNEKILCNLAVIYYGQDKKINRPMSILQELLKTNPSYELARENLQKLFVQK